MTRLASKNIKISLLFLCFTLVASLIPPNVLAAQYVFPVIGSSHYSNDYDAPRANGPHHAIDIIANKGQPIVSAVDGVITYVSYPQPSWGYGIFIRSTGGYEYGYLHMNNDNPGTDDGAGGPMRAYAPDMKAGNRVVRGQLLGWVGDSGNAEETVSHLHFEVSNPDGDRVNPYDSLNSAQRLGGPVDHPALPGEILPFGGQYKGGVNVAIGNVDTESNPETIISAGSRGGPRIRIYHHTNSFAGYDFYAFNANLRSGVDVATGDIDGDGIDEIIAATGPGTLPKIAIFKADGDGTVTKVTEFTTFGSHQGGIRIAAGDVDGDGKAEIIAGADAGGGPRVNVFDVEGTTATQLHSFYPYSSSFRGGVDVASADVTGTSADEIIVAPGKKGGSQVKVYNNSLTLVNSFAAYTSNYGGGVHISAGNVITGTTKAEIMTAPDNGGGPRLYLYSAAGTQLRTKLFMEEWWRGYYDVAAGEGYSKVSTGVNRRGSVRAGL
jgi:hypothetical protein